jgi:uncharacterized membrane protein
MAGRALARAGQARQGIHPELRRRRAIADASFGLAQDDEDALLTSDETLLRELREVRRRRREHAVKEADVVLTAGQRIADAVAATMGSWRFIIIQTTILVVWIALNITAYVQRWDPYPFILLNLALSFQAAYAAPFIMMSQNRQQDVDRVQAAADYQINIKAELEIELLHQKLDALREQEVLALTEAVKSLSDLLRAKENGLLPKP